MKGDVTLIYDREKKKLTIQTDKEILITAAEKLEIQTKELIVKAQQVKVEAQELQVDAAVISLTGQTTINGETEI